MWHTCRSVIRQICNEISNYDCPPIAKFLSLVSPGRWKAQMINNPAPKCHRSPFSISVQLSHRVDPKYCQRKPRDEVGRIRHGGGGGVPTPRGEHRKHVPSLRNHFLEATWTFEGSANWSSSCSMSSPIETLLPAVGVSSWEPLGSPEIWRAQAMAVSYI